MFEYYVLNESRHGDHEIEPFNIFNNWILDEAVQKEVKKYLRSPSKYKNTNGESGFDAFCTELDSLIKWQEWSRCEYEIIVGSLWNDKQKKIDCYDQAHPNIRMIAREVIYQWKNRKDR